METTMLYKVYIGIMENQMKKQERRLTGLTYLSIRGSGGLGYRGHYANVSSWDVGGTVRRLRGAIAPVSFLHEYVAGSFQGLFQGSGFRVWGLPESPKQAACDDHTLSCSAPCLKPEPLKTKPFALYHRDFEDPKS